MPPPDLDGLDPYEVALLAGGRWRLGEVALADAFLDGSVRVERVSTFLRRALIRSAPGALDGPRYRHPVLSSALRRALDRSPEPVTGPPERLVAAAGAAPWIAGALARLRSHGLLLAPAQVGWAQALRRAAHSLHRGAVPPMVVLGALAAAFNSPMLLAYLPGVPALSPVGFFAGSLGPPAVLYLVYRRFGLAAVVAVLTAGAFAFLAVAPFALWAVAVCGLWLGAYGVFTATNRFCGSRTPAGDVVLAAERNSLSRDGGSDRDRALRTVALFGMSGLREPNELNISVSANIEGSFQGLVDFADQCGELDGASTLVGDGGPGGSCGTDGAPGGFDPVGGGSGHGSSGDGGGGSGIGGGSDSGGDG